MEPRSLLFTKCVILSACSYCNIEYKFIQTMETFDEDTEMIVRAAGLGQLTKRKHSNQRKTGASSAELTRRYFDKISPETKKVLFDIYKYDFESFGYFYDLT